MVVLDCIFSRFCWRYFSMLTFSSILSGLRALKWMLSGGGRHGWSVVNSGRNWVWQVFIRGWFLEISGVPFRLTFWGHFGTQIGYYTSQVAPEGSKEGSQEWHQKKSWKTGPREFWEQPLLSPQEQQASRLGVADQHQQTGDGRPAQGLSKHSTSACGTVADLYFAKCCLIFAFSYWHFTKRFW